MDDSSVILHFCYIFELKCYAIYVRDLKMFWFCFRKLDKISSAMARHFSRIWMVFYEIFSLWYLKQSSKKSLQYMYLLHKPNKPQFRKLGLPSSFWNFANRHEYVQFFTNTINITTNRYTIFCKMIWMKSDRWKQWSFLQILSQEFLSPKISPLQNTKIRETWQNCNHTHTLSHLYVIITNNQKN